MSLTESEERNKRIAEALGWRVDKFPYTGIGGIVQTNYFNAHDPQDEIQGNGADTAEWIWKCYTPKYDSDPIAMMEIIAMLRRSVRGLRIWWVDLGSAWRFYLDWTARSMSEEAATMEAALAIAVDKAIQKGWIVPVKEGE